jgi:hypothetical protein
MTKTQWKNLESANNTKKCFFLKRKFFTNIFRKTELFCRKFPLIIISFFLGPKNDRKLFFFFFFGFLGEIVVTFMSIFGYRVA